MPVTHLQMVQMRMKRPVINLLGLHHLLSPLDKSEILPRHHGRDTGVDSAVGYPQAQPLIRSTLLTVKELKEIHVSTHKQNRKLETQTRKHKLKGKLHTPVAQTYLFLRNENPATDD